MCFLFIDHRSCFSVFDITYMYMYVRYDKDMATDQLHTLYNQLYARIMWLSDLLQQNKKIAQAEILTGYFFRNIFKILISSSDYFCAAHTGKFDLDWISSVSFQLNPKNYQLFRVTHFLDLDALRQSSGMSDPHPMCVDHSGKSHVHVVKQ